MTSAAPLKAGMVGCGHISVAHLRGWKKLANCQVVGVTDTNAELAHKRASEFGIGNVFPDLAALLAEVDLVDVCTPPQTHAEIVLAVVKAGRHLLIEKPVVTSLDDWARIERALQGSPTVVTVIHNIKYLHSIQVAKQWCEQGRIGDIIRFERHFLTSPETDRMLVGDKHWSHRLPGGRWLETLPHELYLLYYLVGPLPVTHIEILRTDHAPPGAPADELLITLKGQGCIATIHYSANCQMNKRHLALHGTHGSVNVDLLSDAAYASRVSDKRWRRAVGLSLIEAGQAFLRSIPDRTRYFIDRARKETPHAAIIRATAAHLMGGGPAPTPIDEIAYVVENCARIGDEIERRVSAEVVRESRVEG